MARKKTSEVRVNAKAAVSRRLQELRQELFGEHGAPELARRLKIAVRTWYNYETGVTVPAEILLDFIEKSGASTRWLISGEGPKYSRTPVENALSALSPIELIRRGLELLERKSGRAESAHSWSVPSQADDDFVPIELVPLEKLAKAGDVSPHVEGYVPVYREWLPNPQDTVAVRVPDHSMHPILPAGSIVAIDRSMTDPRRLHGQIVASCLMDEPMIRWLDVGGRHVILRPNVPSPRHPLIPIELDTAARESIIGRVICSWNEWHSDFRNPIS